MLCSGAQSGTCTFSVAMWGGSLGPVLVTGFWGFFGVQKAVPCAGAKIRWEIADKQNMRPHFPTPFPSGRQGFF